MNKIMFLVLSLFFLCACLETKMVVKDENQEQTIEAMLVEIPGIKPNTVIAYTHWLNKEIIEIDFLVYKLNVKPVLGTAINLKYDSQILEYVSYKEGIFLERVAQPGQQKPTYLISPTASDGINTELIVGATLFRGTSGAIGSGKLLTLRFKSRKAAFTEIKITKGKLKGLQADDISGVNWPSAITVPPPA